MLVISNSSPQSIYFHALGWWRGSHPFFVPRSTFYSVSELLVTVFLSMLCTLCRIILNAGRNPPHLWILLKGAASPAGLHLPPASRHVLKCRAMKMAFKRLVFQY